MQHTGPGQEALERPRAAGLAGVVFALLLAAMIILVRLAIPEGADAAAVPAPTDSGRHDALRAALALVPFAGIFFLWFIGAVRAHVGAVEDKFLATVFLGSGLVFTATMFGAAAAASAVLGVSHPAGTAPAGATWDFGRHFAYTLMTGYAMRMAAVFVSSMSVIGHRLGVLPRWLTIVGFLCALTLLFASSNVPWAELVFPAWSLLLSLHILAVSRRPPPRPAAAG
ncbi:hypothetical protein GT045_01345 [Streptomyces sp. SID486]|uniref:hypothetical protein n=1 Tax=unclassified Streptomyces TaxID=2593676 RepID=UPI00136CD03A|nr:MULTISPECIES: hypothetical protein [unclassified Streptomyces]MYW20586.1 hypothetical protein [Streptomyces sp. SID2955]MYW46224.1 hypothetical protein [Streptomyces sp. SID161]MYX93497.1 hypothetical protein [Streptomyces sp. SID486]